MSTALRTDHYELTMLEAALQSGAADRRAVFELFARRLPRGRRFGVVAGIGRLVEAIGEFRFGDPEIAYLRERGFLSEQTIDWLAAYRFAGDVTGFAEGEVWFPYDPVVTVEATFGAAVILETLALSILNHDSAVAAAAARMRLAAGPRATLIEMGGRRTDDSAAVHAARVAILAGFDATSNLEAGRRYGVPTVGTSAHAFTLAHADEREAFAAQVKALGVGTTLLVDTYDTAQGIAHAIEAAGTGLGAVRIDSGSLPDEARKARAQLDALGATGTRIVVSGDLDEFSLAAIRAAEAPVDVFGVGTSLVTGSGHPTADFVYKLVAIEDAHAPGGMRPVAKKSSGKATPGGRKSAWRGRDADGLARHELVDVDDAAAPQRRYGLDYRTLQVPLIEAGTARDLPGPEAMRAHHRMAVDELPGEARRLDPGEPFLEGRG